MFGHQNDQPNTDQNVADNGFQPTTPPVDPATQNNVAPPVDNGTDTAMTGGDSVAPANGVDANVLLDIKQKALNQLSPLVGHLDQSPEEEFRTTMMMIQASDDQSLVKKAYDAAQRISDEKVKAQALLDIVNEINYFTHQQDQ